MKSVFSWIDKVTAALGILSGSTVLIVMLVVCADVVGRSLFNTPLDGATEASELLLACLIFFGLAAAQKNRQHYMVELLVARLQPPARRFLDAFTLLLSAGVTALLCWYSSRQALVSFEMDEVGFGTVAFPIWPARIVVALGLGLFSIQYLVQFLSACGLVREADEAATEAQKS